MTTARDTISAMASLLVRRRLGSITPTREDISRAVNDCAVMAESDLAEAVLDEIVKDIETKLVVQVGRPTTLTDDRDHINWYFGERKRNRRFFERYRRFLSDELGWPPAAVEAIDLSTDLVMEQLEDPNREGRWDRRGLVVGHVQSGKTANYAGLVNKGADAGYKLIIVLAGMHKALRQQTQRRLDRDVLGYDTSSNTGAGFRRIGVGNFDWNIHAEHLTTQAAGGDFNRTFADNLGIGVQQRPVILVVKKNARILENLNTWVRDVLAPRGDTEARPLLVIDDEADQASVDTGDQDFDEDSVPDPEYEPKRINGQIRYLLSAFSRCGYVAYTATPFANILIHEAAEADGYGKDLFPRSFIVNLPTPSNYIGPNLLFGTNDDAETIDVITNVPQAEEAWIAPNHRGGYTPRYRGRLAIPPSLESAILSFILVCAARRARRQIRVHNSMLIYVSRFKEVHQKVFAQVDEWLTVVKQTLRYRTGCEELFGQLKALWDQDFRPTSSDVRETSIGAALPITSWSEVEQELSDAADRIRVQVVNSEIPEALDYDGNPEGLSIIAIGGDKLSRGLTLEGLSVSYFLRASRMYDSLMQMGRWFGYRPGYVDLCRLYLTTDLELWFRHIATAAEELRNRLDHMAMMGSTPEQYGLRIQSHDILLVTAQNKMRHSREFQVSFQGEAKIQTVFFREQEINRRNASRVVSFLDRAGQPAPEDGDLYRTLERRRVWRGISGVEVGSLLQSLVFPDEARDVNGGRLAAYIETQLAAGELTDWTVAVLAGQGETLFFEGWTFKTLTRKPVQREGSNRYVVKTILSPRDEAIDLSVPEFTRALEETNEKRNGLRKPPTNTPDGEEIRRVRGEDPRRALLLIYPLSPDEARLCLDFPVFGVVVSFPDSRNGRSVRYRFNSVDMLERV